MDARENIVDQAELRPDSGTEDASLNSRLVENFIMCIQDICDCENFLIRSLEDDVGSETQHEIPKMGEQGPPRFVIPPKDAFILSNETGIIETRIYCIPKPIVRWYKNGQLITTSHYPGIKVKKQFIKKFIDQQWCFYMLQKHHYIPETYQLEIPNAGSPDVAKYTCIARNCYGSITASANLRVIDLETEKFPSFSKRLQRTEILAEQNGHISVRVSGVPKPKVEWFKDSMQLKETKDNKRIEVIV